MFTIKIDEHQNGYRVFSAVSEVAIFKEGDCTYADECRSLAADHEEHIGDGPEKYRDPRAIIQFETADYLHKAYVYDKDRAWVMNANGKTVASV